MKREIITIENGMVSVPSTAQIWMTQHEITDLFGCFVAKVNSNIRSILKSGVLREADVCRTYRYQNGNFAEEYGLEMIIALSFRIRSHNADVFREWLIKKAVSDTTGIPILVCKSWNNIQLN